MDDLLSQGNKQVLALKQQTQVAKQDLEVLGLLARLPFSCLLFSLGRCCSALMRMQ